MLTEPLKEVEANAPAPLAGLGSIQDERPCCRWEVSVLPLAGRAEGEDKLLLALLLWLLAPAVTAGIISASLTLRLSTMLRASACEYSL